MRYCKTEQGWGRFPAARGRNGKVRPNFITVKEIQRGPYPEGHYELRLYDGSKVQYRNVGDDPTDALAACDRESRLRLLRDDAKQVGAQVVEDANVRLHLRKKAVKFLERQRARGHVRAAQTGKIAIDDFLAITSHTYADEITEDSILTYYAKLRERGNQDRTIYNKHRSLFGYLKWMGVDTHKLAERAPSYTERTVVVYHPDELKTLFDACTPYQRLVLEVLLKTGLRMQEAMHLTWPDVDFRYRQIRVLERASLGKGIKDRGERVVPCPTELVERLQEWREQHPRTRFVLGTGNDTPNWKMREMLKRRARVTGMNCGDCDGCQGKGKECRSWNIKKFRATYTTYLLRDGYDVRTVMDYTGHKDLATVMKYLAVAERMRERIDEVTFLGENEGQRRPAWSSSFKKEGQKVPQNASSSGDSNRSTPWHTEPRTRH
jgi:integrase